MFYKENTNFLPEINLSYSLLIFCFVLSYLSYLSIKPKQYKNIKNININYKRIDIDKDRYNYKKIPNNIDTIIIGSGIGGLSCGAYLSKVGKKVLILEQHDIAGGCMHVFMDKGIEHETGIHYIGNINKSKKILDLITEKPLEWCKMGENNNNIYDEFYIGNKKYLFRAGVENFIKDLSIVFPEEELNIRNYIKLIKKVTKNDIFFDMKIINNNFIIYLIKLYLKYWNKDYYKYINLSAYDVISTFTNNEELKSVLCGQFGDYGQSPKKANFFIHANIVDHYLDGGYFPKGGPSQITKNIIPTIEKSGGRVLVGNGVLKILIENNKAIGVEMMNGDIIYSANVISSVGINNTFNKLVTHSESLKYQQLIKKIGCSTGFIYCFVNLKGTTDELKLRQSNLWIYPHDNYNKLLDDFENNMEDSPMPLFISSSSAKDITWHDRYPNESSIIILASIKKNNFDRWENEKCTKRNLDYKDLKNKLATKMLESLYHYYPETKNKVTHYDVGTPLTNQYYLGSVDGESYGLESSSERYSSFDLKPKTNIKNLYLTGQDICTLGFTGALMSGLMTAHVVLGYGTFIDILQNRNLVYDLQKMVI